jgi:nicotinamide mononucleotide transporter
LGTVISLHELLSPFATHLFTIADDHVSVSELLGFLTGAACVWLTVRRRVSNFPVGIANSVFFLLLFLDTQLYADAWLQVLYVVLGIQGWWAWLHLGPERGPLVVTRASKRMLFAVAGFVVIATAVLYPILSDAHDIAPFFDALTTALSLGAQWLLNLKRLQNWLWWAAADCIYIPLYASKHLALTAVVYVIFLAMCGFGWREWKVNEQRNRQHPAQVNA